VRRYYWLLGFFGAGLVGLWACSPVDSVTISHARPAHLQCPDCSYCPDGFTQLQCEAYWAAGGIGLTDTLPTYRAMTAAELAFARYAVGQFITNTTTTYCGTIQSALYTMLDHGQIYIVDAAAIAATQGYFNNWAERSAPTTGLTDGIIVNELTFIDFTLNNPNELGHALTHELLHPYLGLMSSDNDPYGDGGSTVGSYIDSQADNCHSAP